MRTRGWGILVAAAAVALPAPAHAAQVSTSATAGPSAEEFIEYRASRGERNRVQVHITSRSVVIVDRGAGRITHGSASLGRCRASSRQRVVCPPYDVIVDLRDGDDSITFAPGDAGRPPRRDKPLRFEAPTDDDTEGEIVETATIFGGSGADRISGTRYEDYVEPGSGVDVVDVRGGADTVVVARDGRADVVRGGGGADALYTTGPEPVSMDLAAGTARDGSATERVGGFERVHGGDGPDVLAGSEAGEAIYGGGGSDRIDGRGGNDLLVGDDPRTSEPQPNTISGGTGDDYVAATSGLPAPTSAIDCGAGADRFLGEFDDRLDPSCEESVFRFTRSDVDWSQLTPVTPVSRTAEGGPVYAIRCPREDPAVTCTGRVTLASPPGTAAVTYGAAEFSVPSGTLGGAWVELTDEGRAAVAAGEPVAVQVRGSSSGAFDFGWQQVLPR